MPIYVPDNSNVLKELSPIMVTTPDNVVREIAEGWHTGEDKVSRLVYENIKEPVNLTFNRVSVDKNMVSVWEKSPVEQNKHQWVLRTFSKGSTHVYDEAGYLFLDIEPPISAHKGDKLIFNNVYFSFEKQGSNSSFEVFFTFDIGGITIGEVTVTSDDFPSGKTQTGFTRNFKVILDHDMELSQLRLKGIMTTAYRDSTMWVIFRDNLKDNMLAKHPIVWVA